jgi:NSS family neurotransmitter:Na+ symporter
MHEIGTALFHEELKLSRNKGAWIETIVCCVIATLCALSCGAAPALQLFDMKFIDFCDFITAKFFMPAAAFFTCFLLGWVVPKKVAKEELTNNGKLKGTIFPIYLFLIRYVVPLCIFAIFLKEMNWL